ncbi:uncharacterized protein AB9X84_020341 [Acanthopagrus schlegelii]
MPCLTVSHPKGRGATGPGHRGGREWACQWMEVVQEDREGEPVERRRLQSSNPTAAVRQPQETSRSQTLRTLRTLRPRRGWHNLAAVGVVWSVCQVEAPLHPCLSPVDVCWRLLWVCVLWAAVGVCVRALKCCLRPGQNQGETPLRTQEEVITENRSNLHSWDPPARGPGHVVPLALVLADSLLLCVLQEPLLDPSVPHMKTLLSRLESVSHSLRKADVRSEATPEEADQHSILTDKVKLVCSYLQERMRSLDRLVQVQGDFEASVKDVLEGLDGLWAQLEELHTRVTLTKEASRGLRDLASAQTDAEALLTVLGHYKNRLQCCQAYLTDSTQLLQELTWSHTHISNSVSSGAESVWPELLLQSNIEQFDKVQESFLSVEQQTSTFQAHLQGLGKGDEEGHAGPLAQASGAGSRSVSPQTSSHLDSRRTSDASLEISTSASVSVSSADAGEEAETETPLSLCERSALSFSSTIGRLRKSGRKK